MTGPRGVGVRCPSLDAEAAVGRDDLLERAGGAAKGAPSLLRGPSRPPRPSKQNEDRMTNRADGSDARSSNGARGSPASGRAQSPLTTVGSRARRTRASTVSWCVPISTAPAPPSRHHSESRTAPCEQFAYCARFRWIEQVISRSGNHPFVGIEPPAANGIILSVWAPRPALPPSSMRRTRPRYGRHSPTPCPVPSSRPARTANRRRRRTRSASVR